MCGINYNKLELSCAKLRLVYFPSFQNFSFPVIYINFNSGRLTSSNINISKTTQPSRTIIQTICVYGLTTIICTQCCSQHPCIQNDTPTLHNHNTCKYPAAIIPPRVGPNATKKSHPPHTIKTCEPVLAL